MKNILWTQNESPCQVDSIVIDGVRYDYDNSEELDVALNIISDFSKYKKNILRFDFIKDLGLELSSNLAIASSKKNGYLVQGSYIEKDVEGRKMPYVFWSEDKNIELFISTLQNYSKIVGKTIPENDIKAIEEYMNHKKISFISNKKKLIILVSSLLILIILLWLII